MSKQTKVAYAAGIIDGEGSFSISKQYSRRKDIYNTKVKKCWHRLRIQICNTNKEVLYWFKETFGGLVFETKPTVTGKPVYHWNLGIVEQNTENFLLAIIPYLIIKKQQALLALEFCRLDDKLFQPDVKESLRNRIMLLNDPKAKLPLSPETNTLDASPTREVKIESDLHSDMQSASLVTAMA